MRTDMRRKIDGPIYFKTRVSTNSVCLFLNRFNPSLDRREQGEGYYFPCRQPDGAVAKIEKDFEAANPGIDILREAGGSTKMARMITELGIFQA